MIIYIEWTDLTREKKDALIVEVTKELYDEANLEGLEFMKEPAYKGMSWQETYCREYAIESDYWENDNLNWTTLLMDFLEDKARALLQNQVGTSQSLELEA
jgi:hypothetical protein